MAYILAYRECMPKGDNQANLKESQELKDIIIEKLAQGELISDICRELALAPVTVMRWREKDPIFDNSCIRAQSVGFEIQADSLLTIPDTYEDINRGRLKSENLKWVLARRAASKYGDRIALDVTNTVDLKGALLDAKQRVAKLMSPQDLVIAQAIDVTNESSTTATDSKSVEEKEVEVILAEDLLK